MLDPNASLWDGGLLVRKKRLSKFQMSSEEILALGYQISKRFVRGILTRLKKHGDKFGKWPVNGKMLTRME